MLRSLSKPTASAHDEMSCHGVSQLLGALLSELVLLVQRGGSRFEFQTFPLRRGKDEQLSEETKRVMTLWEWKECREWWFKLGRRLR